MTEKRGAGMRSVLSKRDLRQLEFLELLMNCGPVALSRISEETNYPIRTLSADIKQMNAYLWPIQVVTGAEGVTLEIPPGSSIREAYSLLLRQSREYQLISYLFFNEGKTQEEIAEDLFIGVSTLRRMIGAMNHALQSRDMHIHSAPFRVEGDESRISQLYIGLFSELSYDGGSLITARERETLVELCAGMTEEIGMKLNYPDLIRITIWVYVRLGRIKHGHHTNYAKEEAAYFQSKLIENAALCEKFYSVFGVPLTNELLFELFRLFLRKGFAKNYGHMQAIAAASSVHRLLLAGIDELIGRVAKSLEISSKDTAPLRLDLFNITQFADQPTHILYCKEKVFTEGFMRSHGAIAPIIRKNIETVLGQASSSAMYEIFYLLVTHWPSLIEKLKKEAPGITIGLLFDSDIEHAQMIADIIRQYSKVSLQIMIPELEDMNPVSMLCKGIDLLVTDIPELDTPCRETVCIQEYPTSRDWRNVLLAEERIYRQKIMKAQGPA